MVFNHRTAVSFSITKHPWRGKHTAAVFQGRKPPIKRELFIGTSEVSGAMTSFTPGAMTSFTPGAMTSFTGWGKVSGIRGRGRERHSDPYERNGDEGERVGCTGSIGQARQQSRQRQRPVRCKDEVNVEPYILSTIPESGLVSRSKLLEGSLSPGELTWQPFWRGRG